MKINLLIFAFMCSALSIKAQVDHSSVDPIKYFCVEPSSFLEIRINYEFNIAEVSGNFDQKSIEATCFINAEGYIELPAFFRSIDTGTDTGPLIKLVDKASCQLGKCTTYNEAREILQKHFSKTTEALQNVMVQIKYPRFFSTITVYYKGHTYSLPFKDMRFGTYFSNHQIQLQIGYKRKHAWCRRKNIRAKIAKRCNNDNNVEIVNIAYTFDSTDSTAFLTPGDIIYIQ